MNHMSIQILYMKRMKMCYNYFISGWPASSGQAHLEFGRYRVLQVVGLFDRHAKTFRKSPLRVYNAYQDVYLRKKEYT